MASCPKCGKHPLRKDQTKTFRCRRCGVPGGAHKVLRNGLGADVQARVASGERA